MKHVQHVYVKILRKIQVLDGVFLLILSVVVCGANVTASSVTKEKGKRKKRKETQTCNRMFVRFCS